MRKVSLSVQSLVCVVAAVMWLVVMASAGVGGFAQTEITIPRVPNPQLAADLTNLPGDLRAVAVPQLSDLDDFVRDPAMARALGKALFWDMQVGSDGIQACASCHFRAGADPRSRNQISPGLRRHATPDLTFKTGGGPNAQLQASDFPLTRLTTTGVRGALDSALDSNDAVASQGIHHLGTGDDPLGFQIGSLKTRRVEPRNTPTMINAVFNHRQFWDGRAEDVFNGVNHLGNRDLAARVYQAIDPKWPLSVRVELANGSLASQAVAPIVSNLEMSAPGRTAADVGADLARTPRKIFKRIQSFRPLAKQQVHPADSLLGSLSRWPNRGLTNRTYDEMIKIAFREEWWRSSKFIRVSEDGLTDVVDKADNDPSTDDYSLIQSNFTLFMGIAVQMYEATLVADDTPWDRFRRDHPSATDPALNPWLNTNPAHVSRLALFGAHLFNDRTKGPSNVRCSNCHEQAELTDASVRRFRRRSMERFATVTATSSTKDSITSASGRRPTTSARARSDAFGPLSKARRMFPGAAPANFDGAAVTKGFGVDGAFKVPSLRNVALTAPYFHNGDARTLREVVELYSRGGNVAPVVARDGTLIEPLGLPQLDHQ